MKNEKKFIKGVLATLNCLHWKVKANKDNYTSLSGYGCDILAGNKVNGVIYFDSKNEEYKYQFVNK